MISYKTIGPSSERLSDEFIAVNSCGIEQLSDIDRGSMRKNGRVDYHILYIERGICYVDLQGQTVPVGPGGIILYRPGEPQCYNFLAADGSVSHYIHFTGVGCAQLLKSLGIDTIQIFNMGTSGTYEEISAKMVREYTMKKQYWESFTVGYLYELLTIIARKFALRHNRISHENESLIASACRQIYENLASPPSISELSAGCCLSVSRFSHLFTEVMKKSPNEYITGLRMDRACELLEASDLPIQEIADIVGFADRNFFSRQFRNRFGCSPREFRKKLRAGAE